MTIEPGMEVIPLRPSRRPKADQHHAVQRGEVPTVDEGRTERSASNQPGPMPLSLNAAVAGVGIVSVFQPIVSLADDTVVGFEALTRWPGLNNPRPGDVFAHAQATGRVNPLNRLCVDSAITAALGGRVCRNALLLINSEPAGGYITLADGADEVLTRGRNEFRLMFELTERHLLAHPHALLQTVAALRSDGIGIALDDLGAHPDSLALLDVVLPDIIKLDLALVQSRPQASDVQTLAAVLAHRERSGALILAEGIETDVHLERALAFGATLGQGFKFGRPAPLDQQPPAEPFRLGETQRPWSVSDSPFDIAASTLPVSSAGMSTMLAFSRHIESQARQSGDAPIVLAAMQDGQHFTESTRTRYEELANSSPMVAVFGQHLPSDLGHGIRSVQLDPTDSLCNDWTVVTLGPHTAAALLGRERTDTDPNQPNERRFDLAITYNRTLVTMAARNLLNRIV